MNFFSLPRRLWWSHHLAFLLHDQLLHFLVQGDEEELFLTRFHLDNDAEQAEIESLDDGDTIEWMRRTGRSEEADQVIERTIVRGLLSELCQFLFESIESAAKGKVSVAFALLRKPFRDQLFILEWILADRDGFLRGFANGPESIDVVALLKTRKEWMKQIVETAMAQSSYSEFVDSQLVWELRFAKDVNWTLERYWNKAIHLITTNKHYRTEPENLNFVFVTDCERSDLLDQYYLLVPTVLVHLCGVVRAIVERWNPNFVGFGRLFDMRMVANLELAVRETCNEPVDTFGVAAVNDILNELAIECNECHQRLHIASTHDLEHFAKDLFVRCIHCGVFDERLAEVDETVDLDPGEDEECDESSDDHC